MGTAHDRPLHGEIASGQRRGQREAEPLARRLHTYLRWRNANARHPDVLAQRRERVRIRSE